MKKSNQTPNRLINQSSPYLQQHAHNPVDWYPWGKEALAKAREEQKLIIISIGYSACHWCHVMEFESFEDKDVAAYMNEHFIAIKVDREERPDIDNVYMDAIHLMGQQGGWPLNCIALPDGRPVFAGTYFPKETWISILQKLVEIYSHNKGQMLDYAERISAGLQQQTQLMVSQPPEKPDSEKLTTLMQNWSGNIDREWGGAKGAPKFPMPSGLSYLLRYYYFTQSTGVKNYIETTLDRMASGGIYDHLGGGFARYSVDAYWKVPHFEKMLYDNAQLIGVYAEAWQLFKTDRYKQVVYQTISFLKRELQSAGGGLFAAIDADSEDVEGKFYIWTEEELTELLVDYYEPFALYFNIEKVGNWEHGINVLHNTRSVEEVAQRAGISLKACEEIIEKSKALLFKAREQRIRPATDTKVLTSWNALAISGLTKAYRAFSEEDFLLFALEIATMIENTMLLKDGKVHRAKINEEQYIPGFLDDYALLAQSFIDLYQATFKEAWLLKAKKIVEYAMSQFYNEKLQMFEYSGRLSEALFTEKIEVGDNVIPSSNSVMGNVLYLLGLYFLNADWLKMSNNMLDKVSGAMLEHGAYYSNWAILASRISHPWKEVVVTGPDAVQNIRYIDSEYGFYLLAAADKESELPIFNDRFSPVANKFYICRRGTCNLPVTTLKEAVELLKQE
jgi:uncharacterized protein YyaL (SSP411 family)